MQDAVDFLEEDLKNYRVGKATPAIFNGVTVDYYGTATPLNQVASITTPDAKTIAIQPWERNMISKIEKAILARRTKACPRTAKKRARKSSRRSPTSTSRRSMRSSPRRRKKFSPSRLGF